MNPPVLNRLQKYAVVLIVLTMLAPSTRLIFGNANCLCSCVPCYCMRVWVVFRYALVWNIKQQTNWFLRGCGFSNATMYDFQVSLCSKTFTSTWKSIHLSNITLLCHNTAVNLLHLQLKFVIPHYGKKHLSSTSRKNRIRHLRGNEILKHCDISSVFKNAKTTVESLTFFKCQMSCFFITVVWQKCWENALRTKKLFFSKASAAQMIT